MLRRAHRKGLAEALGASGCGVSTGSLTMIATFTTRVEEKIARDARSAPESVVKIYGCSRDVVHLMAAAIVKVTLTVRLMLSSS